jgi:hypothetical protein
MATSVTAGAGESSEKLGLTQCSSTLLAAMSQAYVTSTVVTYEWSWMFFFKNGF